MSRRRDRGRRPGAEARAGGEASAGGGSAENALDARRARRPDRGALGRLPAQLALLTAVFAVTVAVAELAGAANLGVALGIGQVVFTVVLVALLSRA